MNKNNSATGIFILVNGNLTLVMLPLKLTS